MLQSLLTLDAGITTGYSYWIRHELQDSGGVPYDREAQAFVGVPETLWYKNIELVVMELTKPWIGQLSADLQHVQQIWAGMFPDLVTVQPWQWKPSHSKAPLPKKCSSTHERDAIRMGLWVIKHETSNTPLPFRRTL